MNRGIPLRTARAALAALNQAANWIATGEVGTGQSSWFSTIPSFDRRRKALEKAIAKAEGREG